MKKTLSFGLLTIGVVILVGMYRSKHFEEPKKFISGTNQLLDSINENPIGI